MPKIDVSDDNNHGDGDGDGDNNNNNNDDDDINTPSISSRKFRPQPLSSCLASKMLTRILTLMTPVNGCFLPDDEMIMMMMMMMMIMTITIMI